LVLWSKSVLVGVRVNMVIGRSANNLFYLGK
jgi:hypothetical protein